MPALHASYLSKMCTELVGIKREIARLQLEAFKKDQILKEEREKKKAFLRQQSFELDVKIKEEYLRQINNKRFTKDFSYANLFTQ